MIESVITRLVSRDHALASCRWPTWLVCGLASNVLFPVTCWLTPSLLGCLWPAAGCKPFYAVTSVVTIAGRRSGILENALTLRLTILLGIMAHSALSWGWLSSALMSNIRGIRWHNLFCDLLAVTPEDLISIAMGWLLFWRFVLAVAQPAVDDHQSDLAFVGWRETGKREVFLF